MLELSWKGETPIALPNGDTRLFLKDNDTVIMKGVCVDPATGAKIGFGECSGTILPARPPKA